MINACFLSFPNSASQEAVFYVALHSFPANRSFTISCDKISEQVHCRAAGPNPLWGIKDYNQMILATQ